MNDTHPALAVAELMRILVDEHGLSWARAWALTRSSLAYTNHTLLPEALETWPVPLLEKVIPRHLQIIFEINRRFLETVTLRFPDDAERLERVSLIHESEPQQVRMAHLAIVGSHSVNGVAKLHSHLLRTRVFPDFHELWPERIHNKTNGVTQRRWMLASNPALAGLLKEAIGDGWITQLEEIAALEAHAGDAGFQQRFAAVKRENKARLAATIGDLTGIRVSADALFDVQAKRIHLYKRQLLHLLFVLHEHCRLLDEGVAPPMPRVHVFAGKAAPGYREAKQVIQLIHRVAEIVHRDVRCRDHLQVVFLPDYRVSLAERIIPAADLSEQVSTAGMEASGTGNMKFAMNGALTMGTLDGANIEILEEVGAEHLFLFGKTADEIAALRARGDYRPEVLCSTDPRIARVMEFLASAVFRRGGSDPCREMHDLLMAPADDYFHLADLGAYIDAQTAADAKYLDQPAWTRSAILNVARMAPFSSDRTVREYLERVWCRAEQPVPA
jgi:starch phosphorylase